MAPHECCSCAAQLRCRVGLAARALALQYPALRCGRAHWLGGILISPFEAEIR